MARHLLAWKTLPRGHPSRFSSFNTDSGWAYNRVVAWQDNGLPNEIELAPLYNMSGVGSYNYIGQEGIIRITFPQP